MADLAHGAGLEKISLPKCACSASEPKPFLLAGAEQPEKRAGPAKPMERKLRGPHWRAF